MRRPRQRRAPRGPPPSRPDLTRPRSDPGPHPHPHPHPPPTLIPTLTHTQAARLLAARLVEDRAFDLCSRPSSAFHSTSHPPALAHLAIARQLDHPPRAQVIPLTTPSSRLDHALITP